MWLLFGSVAFFATCFNLYRFIMGKDYQIAMVTALSFTALTLCTEYSAVATWVRAEDWAALLDVVIPAEIILWSLTIVSILLNTSPILLERIRHGKRKSDLSHIEGMKVRK